MGSEGDLRPDPIRIGLIRVFNIALLPGRLAIGEPLIFQFLVEPALFATFRSKSGVFGEQLLCKFPDTRVLMFQKPVEFLAAFAADEAAVDTTVEVPHGRPIFQFFRPQARALATQMARMPLCGEFLIGADASTKPAPVSAITSD